MQFILDFYFTIAAFGNDFGAMLRQMPKPALLILAAILGLLVGSFLNVVIVRLPRMMQREQDLFIAQMNVEQDPSGKTQVPADLLGTYNLLKPASHCPQCQAPVRAWMNIPVLSYLLLRGQCRGCGKPISKLYPAVEIVTGVLTALTVASFAHTLHWGATLAVCALVWALIALTVIDAQTQLLPDAITLPLVWLGLIVNMNGAIVPLHEAVWGAVCGYVFLWLIFWAFKLLTGKEGMGYGDFKLLAALGAWLGVGMLPLIILLSSLVGAVVGVGLLLSKRLQQGQAMPFGPYLATAGMIALFWGKPIVAAYLGLYK